MGCRRVLGLDGRARTYLLSHLTNSMPIENIVLHRISCFFLNGLNHTNNVIRSFFLNVLTSYSSCMLKNINIILQTLKMKYSNFLLSDKNELKREFKNTEIQADWRVKSVKELLDIRDSQLDCILDRYESNMMLKYVSTFR